MTNDYPYCLIETGVFSELDIHFGRLMQSLDHEENPLVFAAAVLVSSYRSKGHVCLDLGGVKKETFSDWEGHFQTSFPGPEKWTDILRHSPVVGAPGDFTPLILDLSSRLYLNRYYEYQEEIARFIKNTGKQKAPAFDEKKMTEILDRLFPRTDKPQYNGDGIDHQRQAAIVSVYNQLCVISGGPGTGKTTTVTSILSLLLELSGEKGLSIILAAPTGKSAARLRESVRGAGDKAAGSDVVGGFIPDRAYTIHRMLGISSNSASARYNRANRLQADVVVVDEASMIDISLMAKLLEALRDDAKLILIGDRHQLASVETGSIFSDICGLFENKASHGIRPDAETSNLLCGDYNFLVQLEKSYRFEESSGIAALSKSVKAGNPAQSLSLLHDNDYADIGIENLPGIGGIKAAISELVINGYKNYIRAEHPEDAINRFDEFRVLCALREGPYGVSAMNSVIEAILEENGLIHARDEWYHGKPIIITANDYNLGLFNGDTGVAVTYPDGRGGPHDNASIFVCFNNGNGIRKIHPNRLSAYETAYAITVHKSQGSEYDRVLVVLPDRVLPIVTRELIYTGITRARSKLDVFSDDLVFKRGVSEKIERASGLYDVVTGG